MDIRQLQYFVAVAEHLSFTKAAKHLFVAQSAVSQQIADLEKKIGAQLFIRNKRSVKLSKSGDVLFKEATYLINKFEEAVKKTRQAELGILGNLNIGFIGYTDKYFLPHLIRKFRHNYPKIDIHLNQFNNEILIQSLKYNNLDLIFSLNSGLEDIPQIKRKFLFQETISAVMHCDHPLANKSNIDIGKLSREPFVVADRHEFPQEFNKTLLICAKGGFTPNIVSETKSLNTIPLLVDAGMGIALLPKSFKSPTSPNLRFIDINEKIAKDKLVVAWIKNNLNSSIPLFIQELILLKAQYDKNPTSFHRIL